MQPLSALEIVQVWEWGQHKHPVDRALGLLTLAEPDLPPDQVAALSVGQRNTRLLTLREQMLGPTLTGYAECTQCGEKLEFGVEISALRLPEPQQPEFDLAVQGFDLRCRLPTSRDLAALVGYDDIDAARQLLIHRCVVQAYCNGERIEESALPQDLIPDLASAVTSHDPQAEMHFALECPACGRQWSALFDIVTFFWTELGDRVRRLLYDVHLLAQGYGWHEADILSMSATRRQMYLEWLSDQT